MKTLFERLVDDAKAVGYQDENYSIGAQARDQINAMTNMELLEAISNAIEEMREELNQGIDE